LLCWVVDWKGSDWECQDSDHKVGASNRSKAQQH
jgi:hypothetical protein